jgi:hypothetical protein
MKRLLQCFLATAAIALALPAAAATQTADFTDLWYNAPADSQSGWGVNLIQQNNTLFVTLFVYGVDDTPRWYVASNVSSTGGNTFSGQLFTVGTGTWFGESWAGISGVRQVGNITFTFGSATTGTMVYTVDNVQVTKSIVRQTWAAESLSGNYIGGLVGAGSNCGQFGILVHGDLEVDHGATFTMTTRFTNASSQQGTCVYTGSYAQTGSQGQVNNGSYNCTINGVSNSVVGTFSISEIKVTRNGFNGRISGSDNVCTYTGFFGGIRDVIQ